MTRIREAPPRTREQEVVDFKKRVFSGMDLLQFFEMEGIGVGAAMHLVLRAEIRAVQHPEYRDLTFNPDLTVRDVKEALTQLMGARRATTYNKKAITR